MEVSVLLERARSAKPKIRKYLQRLARNRPRELDGVVSGLHTEVFAETDCLACANCCKTTSPIFRAIDIDRIAQRLGMRPAVFVEAYLKLDADGDYVLRVAPCPFLEGDNRCQIYADRPRACREYPHTDRKHFHQITQLTLKNTQICPAAFRIVERLQKTLPV